MIFDLGQGAVLGIELCEDLWVPNPPSSTLVLQGANIIANLSASDEYVSRHSIGVNLFQTNRQDAFVHMFTAVHLFLKVRLTLCSAGLHLYVKTVQF